MTVIINGVPVDVAEGEILGKVIDARCGRERPVIVDMNGEIAPKNRWPEIRLREGDRLELIEVVGGG